MKLNIIVIISYLFLLVTLVTSCAKSNKEIEIKNPEPTTRIINFSGYEWVVRTSDEGKQGPGPNYFSDSKENVWVDNDGRLHLKIVEKGGNWYCSGVILRRSQGFKKYVFYLSNRVDQLDENVVGGLFTHKNDTEEIDIEFSKWSNANNQNSQFAIQPSSKSENKVRYDMDLKGNLSTHFIDWQASKIEFGSYNGHTLEPKIEDVISTWTYTGNDIPPENDERLKLNLWLFRGNGPTNNQEAEMIIDRVEIL